jgi:hypothetical protein
MRPYGSIAYHGAEALAAIDEATAESRAGNEPWRDAEPHRLRGDLLQARGSDEDEVDLALLRAKEIAEAEQASSLELGTALGLARHWRSHRPHEDAPRSLSGAGAARSTDITLG